MDPRPDLRLDVRLDVRLILGLGNPGERYRATRHNVGFEVVEELARRHGARLGGFECHALAGACRIGDLEVLLAQPQTYMNRSGHAARCLAERHGLAPEAVLVVFDEVNLPLGRLRLRRAGSPGGHRGMESILESLRTDQVPRLRLGVGAEDQPPPGEDLVDFVLGPFAEAEREDAAAMVKRAADACEAWLRDGIDAAMAAYNR